jgi:hypothetical protein
LIDSRQLAASSLTGPLDQLHLRLGARQLFDRRCNYASSDGPTASFRGEAFGSQGPVPKVQGMGSHLEVLQNFTVLPFPLLDVALSPAF